MHYLLISAMLATLLAPAAALAAAPRPAEVRPLEDFDAAWKDGRWGFSNGGEFPGAKGSFERSKAAAHAGEFGGRLAFDFTGGGNYVSAHVRTDGAPEIAAVRLWVKKPRGTVLTLRTTDQTNQTLATRFTAPDDRWADVLVPLVQFVGHWGGANDGVVHGPPKRLDFLAENTGPKQGEVLLDDIRLVLGKPGDVGGPAVVDIAVARFTPEERWSPRHWGNGGGTRLDGLTWRYDFTKGAVSLGMAPRDMTLPGRPKEFRLRVRGAAPGHPVRVQLHTHFMTFEKIVGELKDAGGGVSEVVFAAPPGEGWKWFGGENDGKLHGPFRLGGVWLEAAGKKDAGQIEFIDLRARTECPPDRTCLLVAERRTTPDGGNEFAATVRCLSATPVQATLVWTLRDWPGKVLAEGRKAVTLPAGAEPFTFAVAAPTAGTPAISSTPPKPVISSERSESRNLAVAVAVPATEQPRRDSSASLREGRNDNVLGVPGTSGALAAALPFVEAEFAVEIPEQTVPPAQAYLVAPCEAPGSAALDPASPFGMGLYLYRYGGDAAGLAEMDRAAAMARAAGVKWSREEFSWGRIERKKGEFDWTFYDNVVATAKRHGITVYGECSYWTGWTKPYTPEGIEDYARFAAAAAARYKADIRHWEIWNEPNIFFWQGPRDMYADLLKASYAAVKKANPEAAVLGCSTAGIDKKFIQRTMELGAPFDDLTIHPYRGTLDDAKFVDELKDVARLVQRPDGSLRPVWITEMGWATHTEHNGHKAEGFRVTTQRDQARLIVRSYVDAIASGVIRNVGWYNFRNDGTDPFNFESNMGIITRDFRPKPAYRAYATMTQTLAGKRFEKPLDLGPNVVAYRFAADAKAAGGKEAVVALWCLKDNQTVTLPAPKAATLVDLMGGRSPLAAKDGKVSVTLEPETPVFVVVTE